VTDWLEIRRGPAPLILSFPHTGTVIPAALKSRLESPWLSRKDADWWVHELYDELAQALGATTVRTAISRSVIDVNRDPEGKSLYPGQATTDLCPLTTFDGERLYRPESEPGSLEVIARRKRHFEPYHAALATEIERLRSRHGCVVLYDAHSIRSRVPRLFDGLLPHLNIGTYDGASCDAALTHEVERACDGTEFSRVTNGRFRGGWTTRHYGQPSRGVHALQMELACRGYLDEPDGTVDSSNWPQNYDRLRAEPLRQVLGKVLQACLDFAHSASQATTRDV
jgi:N-formylglutamate deformylase